MINELIAELFPGKYDQDLCSPRLSETFQKINSISKNIFYEDSKKEIKNCYFQTFQRSHE